MVRIDRFRGPPGAEDRPWLLTAGPVTTARGVRLAQLGDWDGADPDLRRMADAARGDLARLAGAGPEQVSVLVPGPPAVAREALLALTASPSKRAKTLVIVNSRESAEAAALLDGLGRPFLTLRASPLEPVAAAEVDALLALDKSVTQVWCAPFSPDAGVLSPLKEIAGAVQRRGRSLMVDMGAGFGALPVDMAALGIMALAARADGALESAAGLSFVMVPKRLLTLESKAPARAVDLPALAAAQAGGEGCALPGPQLAALHAALGLLAAEGGVEARAFRYRRNAEMLDQGMRALGFVPLLQGPGMGMLVQAFRQPGDRAFDFARFDGEVRRRGFALMAGAPGLPLSFRMASMGQLEPGIIHAAVNAVADALRALGVDDARPAR